jgi:hypothetical protein
MATQKGNNYSGIVGPVVFFTRNGKQGVRARPTKVKRTQGMKANSNGFGHAARIGSVVRSGLKNFVPNTTEAALMHALNDCLRKWLKFVVAPAGNNAAGFATLEGFEINAQALLKEKLRVHPTVDWSTKGKISVQIPAMVPTDDIASPPTPTHNATHSVRWELRALDVQPGDDKRNTKGRFVGARPRIDEWKEATITMPYTNKTIAAQTVQLDMTAKPKHVMLVFLRLVYLDAGGMEIVDERWRCGGIVGAKY